MATKKSTKATKTATTRKKKTTETPVAESEIIVDAVAALAEPQEEMPEIGHNAEPAETHEVEPALEAEPVAEEEIEPEPAEPAEEDEAEELPAVPAPRLERLQKILAQAGIASRRHAEELITTGRVQVNGQTVTILGSKADPTRDHIRVDGKLLQGAERLRYFMLHKPKGYVTTVSDPEGRPTVMEFFKKTGERLYPVGRLDYLSEGLLLVTNDGELANALTRAAAGVEKTYLVKVSGQPTDEDLDRLREGVAIERGKPGEGRVRTAPARIRQVREGENPWFEVVLIEGRNRELRKMFEEIGHHVEKIRRVGYGPLVLDIPVGKTRELDPEEIEALRLTAEGKLKPRRLKTKKMLPRDAGKTVIYDEEEKPRSGKKPFFKKPEERREIPERTGRFEKRTGGFEKPAGRFEKRSGGFEKPARSFEKPASGYDRPSGRFEKPTGRFEKPAGRFEKPAPRFEKPAARFEKPARFGKFEKPGRFEKPNKFEKSARFERPGKFGGKFLPKDRPFRPREERTEDEGRGFAPRREEFQPRRGGSARFGRPEGGRTGNRRDDRGFRPDDRPQKPFRPRPERRPFDIVEEGSEQPRRFAKPAGKPFRPKGDRPFSKSGTKFGPKSGPTSGPKSGPREGGFRGKPKPGGKSSFGFKGNSGPRRGGFKPQSKSRPGGRPGGRRER